MRVPSVPTNRKAAFDRYKEALRNIPQSGGGGCHSALLGIANRGRIAGVSRDRIAEDLAAHVHGTRKIPGLRSTLQSIKRSTPPLTIAFAAPRRDPVWTA